MKRDPWLPVAMMLVVLLSVWLGIAGPLLGDATTGFYEFLKSWQTALSAIVGIGALTIAWKNVSRQLRLNLITREEERIEAMLPGLREAHEFTTRLRGSVRIGSPESSAKSIEGIVPDGQKSRDFVRSHLANATEAVRTEVHKYLQDVLISGRSLRGAIVELESAQRDLDNIEKFDPAAHANVRETVELTRAQVAEYLSNVADSRAMVDVLRADLNQRQQRLNDLLRSIRTEIDTIILKK